MHQNPVSSLTPAGGTIGCDLQRKIAMPDAIVDDLPVARLYLKTNQTYRNIKARLNANPITTLPNLRRH